MKSQDVWEKYLKAIAKKLASPEGSKEHKWASAYADSLLKQYNLLLKTELVINAIERGKIK